MLKKFSAFLRTQLRSKKKSAGETQDALFLASREVQENISEAVNFLKERLLSFKAFQQMPWYLVLGAKNTGKTQLLANSEIAFLEKERFVQLTPQGMETKSGVNWWLSPGAVLIDVPGSYLEEASQLTASRAAWFELLRQIRRYRFRRPLNGIILTVAVKSLQKNNEEIPIDKRIQEVLHRLKQRLPIYLVITQMDQIQGFHEYFDDLGKNERDQYAGLTFPLSDKTKTAWVDIFSESFDQLISNMHQRVLWRVNQEQDISKRHTILNFPQQLNSLRESLKHYIHTLNNLSAHTSLRGIYFTSSLSFSENPHIIDHISETVEKQFSLISASVKTSALSLRSLGTQKSFFIKSLFEQKIFPESQLANDVLRITASRQENFLRWGALGVAGAMLLSITLTLSSHYKKQTIHLNTANTALSDYKLLVSTYNPAHPEINTLLPALDALALAEQSTAKARLPWLLRFQLHRQEPLGDLTDRLYMHDLQTKLIPAVRYQLELILEKGDVTDSSQLYDLLKAYLMLGDPIHADKIFLEHWFYHVWQNPLLKNQDFRKHWDIAINSPMPILSSNAMVVQKTRATLNALPYDLLSHAILRNQLGSGLPLNIQDNTRTFVFSTSAAAKLYTVSQIAQANSEINNALYIAMNGNWVLGSKASESLSTEALKTLQNNLINEYIENYVNSWQAFLSQTKIQTFSSLNQLEQALSALTQNHTVLEQLFSTIRQNTYINNPDNNTLTLALSNKLNLTFGALNRVSLADIQVKLQNLKAQIQVITQNQNPDAEALEVAQNLAQQKGHDAILALIQQANNSPEPLKTWLLSLAKQSRDLILSKASSYAWMQWQLQVLPLCRSTIENHYPFDTSSSQEISLYDFARFFEKGGIFDQFFTLYLSPFVQTNTAKWQWKNIDGGVFDTASHRLAQFERANIIKTLYFNHKNQLETAFTLSQNKDIQHYIWPVNTHHMSVKLFNADDDEKILNTQGEWAIFRLINKSKLIPHPDGKTYDLVFENDDLAQKSLYKSTYVLNTALINPFVPGVIDQFRCP